MFLLFSVSHWFLWPDPLASHYMTHLPMFITDRRRLMGDLWRSDIISQHRRTPSMAVHSHKCERVNKKGHFSNRFPSVCENYCATPPQSLSQPVSEHMECVSSVLQMLRWNPPRAGGWIHAKAMASPWHFYFCVRMWLQGLLPGIIAALARKGRDWAPRSHRRPGNWRAFWLVQVFAAAITCCLIWAWR